MVVLAHGGGHTGWSRAWIINFYAKLRDAESAWENIRLMLTNKSCVVQIEEGDSMILNTRLEK